MLGGVEGMIIMDWFDVLLHGLPFVLLVRLIYINVILSPKKENNLIISTFLKQKMKIV